VAEITITTLKPEHAPELERLQIDCYPTLAPHERMRREHFAHHAKLFPEGNFVALLGGRVVGLGSGFLTEFDLERPDHTFQEIIAGGFYTHHDPQGAWYYGGDISVHPEVRGRGVGRRLYDARKALVQRLGRRGIVAGGLLPGYAAYKGQLSVHDYVAKVVAGELSDPTLSFQLRNGFRVRGLLPGYLEDSASEGWATLIVWENPAWRPQ
jgi:GNAT superfamily N-acetyltransferase